MRKHRKKHQKSIDKLIIIFLMVAALPMVLLFNYTSQERLSELQIVACNAADEGNTCDTKLDYLSIVTKEQCCKELGKCCT